MRPFLGGHGGDVELLEVDEDVGAVHLRLLGSCDGCPSSAMTLRLTVERAILEAAPEISVIDVDEPSADPVTSPVALDPQAGGRLRPRHGLWSGAVTEVTRGPETDPRHAPASSCPVQASGAKCAPS